ncbi:MAG TPA: hypothetical protein VGK73_04550 [Polyangiaceae bacterium]
MITPVDDRLRREAAHFGLRFRCEECVHFAPERAACGNGYPTEPHRGVELGTRTALEFCKEFELA